MKILSKWKSICEFVVVKEWKDEIGNENGFLLGCWMLDVECWMLDVGCWSKMFPLESHLKLLLYNLIHGIDVMFAQLRDW